jgi:transposase
MNGPKRNGAGGARGSRTLKLLICTIFLGLGASAYATEKPPSPVPPSKQPVKKVQGFRAAAPLYHLNTQNERIDVRVVLNRSENVKVEYPFTEALVTNSDIADVVPLTNASINILGKKIGNTRLSLLDQDKRVIGIVDIEVSHDVDMLRRVMRDNPSFSNLRVAAVILWRFRTGSPWAEIPERYGPATTCYNRFVRWRKAGVWDRLLEAVSKAYDGDIVMIDSTCVRVRYDKDPADFLAAVKLIATRLWCTQL